MMSGLAVLSSGFYNPSPMLFLGTTYNRCWMPEVYKNRTWANFLHMGVTRVLLLTCRQADRSKQKNHKILPEGPECAMTFFRDLMM